MVNQSEVEKHISAIMNFRITPGMEEMEQFYLDRLQGDVRTLVLNSLQIDELMPGVAHVISERDDKWYQPSWYPGAGNWKRYRALLERKGLDEENVIQVIDNATTQILCELTNPNTIDEFQDYGLVLGYVQSGKTANYTGLIAKAVDAGYDMVIILAGLHNNLRLQTQRRLDRELTGVEIDELGGILVEQPPTHGLWRSLTLDDDFNVEGNARHTISSRRPVYAVMKKNVIVLEKFLDWLSQAGDDVLSQKSLLLIDDEADHATVNTGNSVSDEQLMSIEDQAYDIEPGDLDPSRTNECIRRILKLFQRRAYVGYTATPFANVLIDPFEESLELGPTLYPRNFIISLPKPLGYIGAEDMFPETLDSSSLEGQARIIPSEEADRIRELSDPPDLPSEHFNVEPSLRRAMLDFILTGCCKIERGFENFHHSMLVHVHHMKDVQSWLTKKVEDLWKFMKKAIQYHHIDSSFIDELGAHWNEHFLTEHSDVVESWEDIKKHVHSFCKTVFVREINSSNPEGDLDYDNHQNGLKVIAVGGNKLSRGLTLEGLTVSYFGRPTQMYDSLLQMGRWFGFRPGYSDLVRLHLTAELLEWFSWLAHVERQIRIDIERYDRLNKSPLELAVRIRTHPQLVVTSKLKSRSAIEIKVGWDGQTAQTLYFHYKSKSMLIENLNTTSELVSELRTNYEEKKVSGSYVWTSVPGKEIIQFMNRLNYPEQHTFDRRSMVKYIQNRVKQNELNSWSVALINVDSRRRKVCVGGLDIGTALRTRQKGTRKIPDLVDSKHWSIDLEGHPDKFDVDNAYFPRSEMLKHRDEHTGLLLMYILDAEGSNDQEFARDPLFEQNEEKAHILALGIAFPISDDAEGQRMNYMVVKGVESDENR